MRNIAHNLISMLLVPSVAVGIAGCGSKDAEKPKPATQIAAKVNSGEISVHQLNYVLTRTPGVGCREPRDGSQDSPRSSGSPGGPGACGGESCKKSSTARRRCSLALENSRREILARAYVEQITSAVPKPTTEEAKKYYAENPALFAERRIYNLQEIVLPATAGVAAELDRMINPASRWRRSRIG